MGDPSLSVILTTYNKPHDLERVLEGFRAQTHSRFEVLVCDDGSGEPTRALVERFAASVPFPVRHCWQEDRGFRAAASRNNGARAAEGDLLVFVDGDCVPFPDFLARHAARYRADTFLAGERYLLEPEEAEAVTVGGVEAGSVFGAAPRREVRRLRSLRWKNAFYRWSGLKPERPHLMTANCSVPTAVFRAVNGLDERYEGWGHEDEDLRRRMVRRGARHGSIVGQANCLHLWHKADPTFLGKRKLSPNWRYYDRGFQLSRCRRGLVTRGLDDVCAVVHGAPSHPFRAPGADDALELEVVWDTGEGAPRVSGRAEVSVWGGTQPPRPGQVRGAQVVLGPGLEAAGGELPGETLPEVGVEWAKVGVRATRPATSWEEALDVLEGLL